MQNRSQTEISFCLEQGECNGYMNSQWFFNDKLVYETKGLHESNINLSLDLPGQLVIVATGKNPTRDTKVDDNNNIVQDKYIKLSEMYVARYPVKSHVIRTLCQFTADDGSVHTSNYFHRNGKMVINFESNDPIAWHIQRNL